VHAAAAITDARLTVIPALALLEDHLNAVLRHGETLRALERPVAIAAFDGPGVPAMIRRNRQIDVAVREAHALELSIVLRLTQARVAANDAKRHVPQAAALLRLVATAADLVAGEMPSAPTSSDFFAARGIAVSSESMVLGEGYLIAAKTPLAAVMDAAAAALDMIDLLGPARATTGNAATAL
jgi:hypothetical protein